MFWSLIPVPKTWSETPPGVLAKIDEVGPLVDVPSPKKSMPVGRLTVGVWLASGDMMFVHEAMIGALLAGACPPANVIP